MRGWGLVLVGCVPTFEDRLGLVDEPRILAVRGTPAEVRPGESVALEALVVSPTGLDASTVAWAYCDQPRTVEERTGVTAACLRGDQLVPVGALATVPFDACARFGPNPPPVEGDEPPRRPADPDPTGGYFLPLHASTEAVQAFGFQRIRCDLEGATRAVFDAFEDRYEANRHPTIAPLDLPAVLDPGTTLDLVMKAGADDAEPYVVYVAEESALFDRVETLTAFVYVTAGDLSLTQVSLVEGQGTTQFTAPDEPATVHGWVVLVDARGGLAWEGFTVAVAP